MTKKWIIQQNPANFIEKADYSPLTTLLFHWPLASYPTPFYIPIQFEHQ